MKALVRVRSFHLLRVPQFLVLVLSGERFHADSAWLDANTASTFAADIIRYYVHFVKVRYSLPDVIRYSLDLKPRLLQPPFTKQDDRDPEMNAVCSESSAIEKAKTEASAPPEWSDGFDLETARGSLQQTSRIICTTRDARSSGTMNTVKKVFRAFLNSWEIEK